MLRDDEERKELLNIDKIRERKNNYNSMQNDKGKRKAKGKGQKEVKEQRIAGRNIIFVAGLGNIGMMASREIVKKGPKVNSRRRHASSMKRKGLKVFSFRIC